jgi:hypothetical protein
VLRVCLKRRRDRRLSWWCELKHRGRSVPSRPGGSRGCCCPTGRCARPVIHLPFWREIHPPALVRAVLKESGSWVRVPLSRECTSSTTTRWSSSPPCTTAVRTEQMGQWRWTESPPSFSRSPVLPLCSSNSGRPQSSRNGTGQRSRNPPRVSRLSRARRTTCIIARSANQEHSW